MEEREALFSLTIDPVTKVNLTDTAKWARFLAIVGMVVLVLVVIASMFGVTFMTGSNTVTYMGGGMRSEEVVNSVRLTMIGTTLIFALVAFFPLLFLLQFANRMRRALTANDQHELNYSFQQLKRYFRYLGIIVIIVLAIYVLFFVLMIIGIAAVSR